MLTEDLGRDILEEFAQFSRLIPDLNRRSLVEGGVMFGFGILDPDRDAARSKERYRAHDLAAKACSECPNELTKVSRSGPPKVTCSVACRNRRMRRLKKEVA